MKDSKNRKLLKENLIKFDEYANEKQGITNIQTFYRNMIKNVEINSTLNILRNDI